MQKITAGKKRDDLLRDSRLVRRAWLILLIAVSFGLTGCYTLYTAVDGDLLLPYGEPEALKVLTENPDPEISIIDVRPASAYQRGHIPTALSYPSSEISRMVEELSMDQFLIVYCETGGRAQMVISKLEEEGYTRMLNWGGYTRWPYELVQ